jgi:hypothetical protein
MMMQDQDTQLDSISGTLHNLKDIAGTMHQEVEDHVVYVVQSTVFNTIGNACHTDNTCLQQPIR